MARKQVFQLLIICSICDVNQDQEIRNVIIRCYLNDVKPIVTYIQLTAEDSKVFFARCTNMRGREADLNKCY